MTDIVTKTKRSQMMAGIKGRDTKPEIWLRTSLHKRGYRYRKNVKGLPGKPDIYFPTPKAAIFVNGCFWHGHENCHLYRLPKSNTDFWEDKIRTNQERDKRVLQELAGIGIRYLVIWECSIKGKTRWDSTLLLDTVENWIRNGSESISISGTTD